MDRRRFRTALPVVTLLALVVSGSGALRATSGDALGAPVDPAVCRPADHPTSCGRDGSRVEHAIAITSATIATWNARL